MLVKLSMVERAIRLSERCSTLGPRSSTSPPAMGSTAGRFTSGPCAPPRARRARRQRLQAGSLSPPDRSRGRGPHRFAAKSSSRLGPRAILNKPRRERELVPSRSAIYRCLVRDRLIDPKPRRRRRDDYKRWERSPGTHSQNNK